MTEKGERIQRVQPPNKRISIETAINVQVRMTRHTSVMYGAQFLSKDSIFRRNRSSEVSVTNKIQKNQIFSLVYRFLGHIITDSGFLEAVLSDLHYERDSSNISVTKISKSCFSDSNTESDRQFSERSLNHESQDKVNEKLEVQKTERKQKLSIMVEGSSSEMDSNSWFSSQGLLTIDTLKFPKLLFSVELIEKIFQEPEPFLVNLSLCLMVKFIHYSKTKINCENVTWILSVATIIAYKIYYDEPVEGLIDSFAGILEISNSEAKLLQRYFLQQIQFQAVITNQQYHIMLSRVLQA